MAEPVPARLTLADQALVNLVAQLLLMAGPERRDEDLVLDCIREVLPGTRRELRPMAELIAATEAVLALAPARATERGGAWGWAMLDLRRAAERFFMWRSGLALDAYRAEVVA